MSPNFLKTIMVVPGCPLSLRNLLRIILMDITLWIITH